MFFKRKNKENSALPQNLPAHIGVIMDGNGRWAKKHGLPRSAGHKAGAEALKKIVTEANNMGVKYITVYAFSTENWSRPEAEVNAIMELLTDYLNNGLKKLEGKDTKVRIIGNIDEMSEDIRKGVYNIEEKTKNGKSMTVQIALNYGGRAEIVSAAKKAAEMVKKGEADVSQITEELLSSLMYNPEVPDPDLIIRPSGEYRLSNFLLWGSAYSELWFSDILWPDFKDKDLLKAIYDYQKRSRRFGGV